MQKFELKKFSINPRRELNFPVDIDRPVNFLLEEGVLVGETTAAAVTMVVIVGLRSHQDRTQS